MILAEKCPPQDAIWRSMSTNTVTVTQSQYEMTSPELKLCYLEDFFQWGLRDISL